jgi:hypothetical protein
MKTSLLRQIADSLKKADERLVVEGRMLVLPPTEHILRALFIEDASNPQGFYLWSLIQPLFQPASSVSFNFGKRVGGASHVWLVTDAVSELTDAVRREALPFLEEVSTPESFGNWSFIRNSQDVYAAEATAYALVLAGRFSEGIDGLNKLNDALSDSGWQGAMKGRAVELIGLTHSDPAGAKRVLESWEKETRLALKLS